MMKMPFGKFRGVLIADLPDDYLGWLRGLGTLREPVRRAVETEWSLRFDAGTAGQRGPLSGDARQMAEEIISAGYRKLAALNHPDHGGETNAMQAVNSACEWLRRSVRSA